MENIENIKTEIHVLCPTYFTARLAVLERVKPNEQNAHIFKTVH
jgi:hypothetical protein